MVVRALAAADMAADGAIQPQVKKIVEEVSAERIRETIAQLVSFGTRNTLSPQDDPEYGIGAARKWIFAEFQSYSPRLQVRYDHWRVKKTGRIFKDADLYNVVAVLPGKTMPEVEVVVSAHYDSINIGKLPAGEGLQHVDWEKTAELPAPGACDDGSGIAAVMELARVMSHYEFSKTLVFLAFAGEEQGLVGSTLEAAQAKKDGTIVEAVLNNDIIGTDVRGDGRTGNNAVNVYSDDRLDSQAQELARYVRWAGALYVPYLKVNPQYAPDRLGRGGDQTPFQREGFSAVRITTANEILANQHNEADTLENMSVPYTTRVAQLNAAAAGALALAPPPPDIRALAASAGSARLPMISRGNGYDAVLRWRAAGPAANLKGYAVVMKSTTAPFWEQEIFVGNVTEFALEEVSIDDTRFGVKAIGNDGTESLVATYAYPPWPQVEYKTE